MRTAAEHTSMLGVALKSVMARIMHTVLIMLLGSGRHAPGQATGKWPDAPAPRRHRRPPPWHPEDAFIATPRRHCVRCGVGDLAPTSHTFGIGAPRGRADAGADSSSNGPTSSRSGTECRKWVDESASAHPPGQRLRDECASQAPWPTRSHEHLRPRVGSSRSPLLSAPTYHGAPGPVQTRPKRARSLRIDVTGQTEAHVPTHGPTMPCLGLPSM